MFRILIVDDEPFVREGLKIIFEWENYGFEICGEAENGFEACEIAEELKPDLIITDVKMPLMDGINLIKSIREKGTIHPKFIILSGYNDFKYAKSAMKYNVNDYLLKPIDTEELINTLVQIRTELEQQIRVEQSRNEGLKAIIQNNLRSIIKGTADNEEVKQTEKAFNINDKDYIYYVMLSIEKYYSCCENRNINNLLVKELILKLIGKENQYCLIEIDSIDENSAGYAIILTSNLLNNFRKDIKYFTGVLCDNLTESIKENFMIYVGKPVNNLELLNDSYNSAMVAGSYKFFSGNNKVIFYNEIKNVSFCNASIKKISFDTLAAAIENYERDKIGYIIDDIFKNAKQDFIDPLAIEINIKYLIHQVLRITLEMNGDVGEIIYNYEITNSQMKHLTIEKTKQMLYKFSIGSAEYLQSICGNHSGNTLFKIEKYISENYSESLTLKSIANKFFINPAYLGQIFKKKYGLSFNDYLLTLRIEKAQNLLMKTDMKVYEVSEQVGYKDCDYFIANFEKVTGLTPLQFRKNIMVK